MVCLNVFLLVAQAALYFTVMISLLRARKVIGIGVFMCALGVMHFLETYLASVFYIALPFGIVSPGSTILFSGKLLMILLLYIREDAAVARQPIYGLLFGNFLIVGLVMILRNHETVAVAAGRLPNIAFVDEIGWLMVWGTVLLYIDAIAIIVLYERLSGVLRRHLGLRLAICGCAVLTFDQAGFFLALHYVSGAPWHVFWGGWIAKMFAALLYTGFFLVYMRYFSDEQRWLKKASSRDVFQILTFRERYNDLLKVSSLDHLTGVAQRRIYDEEAPRLVTKNLRVNRHLSLLVIDIDHFKQVNDQFGHQMGDVVLKEIAGLLKRNLRSDDHLYRFGGEEFILLCENLSADIALSLGERLRMAIEQESRSYLPQGVSVSIGLASLPEDGLAAEDLFKVADERLYMAKKSGRNRICGPKVAA